MSAKEFFAQVDFDGDGKITEDEFLRFWRIVKASGNTEEDMMQELENIRNGESWGGFSNLPKELQNVSLKSTAKKH